MSSSQHTTGSRASDDSGVTRRRFVRTSAAASAGLLSGPSLRAWRQETLLTKPIPSTGERLPVIGIGTALNHYSPGLAPEEMNERRRVFDRFVTVGGRMLDVFMGEETEAVCGQLIQDLGRRDDFFIATKVGFFPDERPEDPHSASTARLNASFRNLNTEVIDLMQVSNLFAWEIVLPILREWKEEGRFRYVGVTVFQPGQHDALETVIRSESLDFVQLNYSLEGRDADERLLPMAADRGIAVIANVPFGRGAVFRRVGDRELPGWAAELGCDTMAQVALKFVVSHPHVTCAIPGTYRMDYLLDNMGAARGPMPDASMRRTVAQWYDALPAGA